MDSRTRLLSRRGLILKGAAASALSLAGGAAVAAGQTGGVLTCSVRHGFPGLLRELTASALTEVDGAGRLSGALASEWRSSSDGCKWDFRIRADQTFHDGSALTPDAIAASLNSSASVSPWRQVIHCVDPYGIDAVRVTTHSQVPSLPLLLAEPEFRVTGAFRDAARVGTGPYRITSATEDHVTLARAPGLIGVGSQAHFERLVLQYAAGETGDALRYADAEIGILADHESSNPRRGFRWVTTRTSQFALTLSAPTGGAAKLVDAIGLGLEWSSIGDGWLGNACHLAADPAWRGTCVASGSEVALEHDPDRARRIVRGATPELDIRVSSEVIATPGSSALLRGMAKGLGDIGLVPRFTTTPGENRFVLEIRETRLSPSAAHLAGTDPQQRPSISPLTLDSRALLRRTVLGEEGTGLLQWSRA